MSDISSTQAIQDFVNTFNLRNKHSIIQFQASVTIRTAMNEEVFDNIPVSITLDGYDNPGTLTLLDSDIDPQQFPTVLYAKWQSFTFSNKEFLLIEGDHKKNSNIGEYELEIRPLI